MTTIQAFVFVGVAVAGPADDFLFALRERGWHDTALEYLSEAENDPLATPAFIEKIAYERAVTQSALARLAPSEKLRLQGFEQAATAFQQFAASQPDSPLQIDALSSAGNLYNELALLTNNKAEKLPAAAKSQRAQLGETARGYLDQAKQPLKKLQGQCEAKLKSLPKAAELQKNKSAIGSRQQLEGKLAESKFLLAKLDFEKARTYAPNSKQAKQTLKSAASAFAELYKEYEDKLVGFYGRYYEGRSYQVAGEVKKALEAYLDIVDQPPIPNRDFRRLVSRAHRYRAECHIATKDFDKAIKECRQWLEEATNTELAEPDWLAVSFQLATAYEAKAANGGDAKKLNSQARKLYREIAKQPGEHQRDAKAKLAAGGGGRERPVSVNTFDEAFVAGKEALESMNSAKMAVKIAKENNPDSVDALASQAKEEQHAAAEYFRQATGLADSLTDREELTTARYYLCWLYWEDGRLDEAAVLGEYIARRNPDHNYAAVAAKLALASNERLYNAAKQAGDTTDFEAKQLAEVAELLVTRWPTSPEAEAALNLLINIALRDNRLADAEKLLERLPPASRAGAELRLGGAVWTRYLRAASKRSGDVDETTADLKRKAGKLLENGYQTAKTMARATASEATGVLYLAQYLLAEGQAEAAVSALENDTIGPLTLIKKKSPATSRPQFKQEAYKVGLRSYLSTQPPMREKAEAMMAALESAIGKGKGSEQKLISIYVSLGLQLQQQISDLNAAGQTDKASAVAKAFAVLLSRVTERAGAADSWKIQSWIAQTNLQLGQRLGGDNAKQYLQQAEQVYKALLEQAAKQPKFAPSPLSVLATKKKLADCQLAQANYSDAFEQYALILKGKPNMLELQQAAASALQLWGAEAKQAKRLEEAIRGALPQANGKNLVWGWLRIAAIADQAKRKAQRKAETDPKQAERVVKYENLFFEARYHAAEARFEAAKLATGADRKKQIGTARQSLESMKRLYPELGGPVWQNAYLKLLQQMEQEK